MLFEEIPYIKPNEAFDKTFKGCIAYKKVFAIDEVKKAKIKYCTLGFGKCILNGVDISESKMISPISNFYKTLWFLETDITQYLQPGQNEIIFILNGGYFNEAVDTVWKLNEQPFRDYQQLKAIIEFEDGKTICTDNSWEYTKRTPFIFSQTRCGEYFDSRINYSEWQKVATDRKLKLGKLRKYSCEPIIEKEEIFANKIIKLQNNCYVFDFGVNFAGYLKIEKNLALNQEFTIQYAENLDGEDILTKCACEHYFDSVIQTDKLIGNGEFIKWTPSFNYHGFRYVKISSNMPYDIDGISAVRIIQDIPMNFKFNCSDKFLVTLIDMYVNSIYSNTFNMLTDCPTREKLGWFNDAFGSAESLAYLFDVRGFYKKYLQDILDAVDEEGNFPCMLPACEWGYKTWNGFPMSAIVFEIPYQYYKVYGDNTLLKKAFKYFNKIIDFEFRRVNEKGLLFRGLYDWVGQFENMFEPPTPSELTDSAIFSYCLDICKQTAEMLNEDVNKYSVLNNLIKMRIIENYLDDEGKCVVNAQTALSIMIHFGLYKDIKPLKQQLKELIEKKQFHHDCGTIGLKYLYSALSKCGLNDYAYKIITANGFPSYRDWVQAGETSLCETWCMDSSQNHHMFSTFTKFYIETLMGIQISEVGFSKIEFNPYFPENLTYLSYELKTIKGTIFCKWERVDGKINLTLNKPKGIEFLPLINNELVNCVIEEY